MSTNSNILSQSSDSGLTRRDVLKILAILPIASLPTVDAPSAWVTSQTWRSTFPTVENVGRTNTARLSLWDLDLYPTGKAEKNPAHVANLKAALQQIIEELNEADLDSVYRLARLYALFPDVEGKVWAKQAEGWLGFDGVIESTGEEEETELMPVDPGPSKKEYLDRIQATLDTLEPSDMRNKAQAVLNQLRLEA